MTNLSDNLFATEQSWSGDRVLLPAGLSQTLVKLLSTTVVTNIAQVKTCLLLRSTKTLHRP